SRIEWDGTIVTAMVFRFFGDQVRNKNLFLLPIERTPIQDGVAIKARYQLLGTHEAESHQCQEGNHIGIGFFSHGQHPAHLTWSVDFDVLIIDRYWLSVLKRIDCQEPVTFRVTEQRPQLIEKFYLCAGCSP